MNSDNQVPRYRKKPVCLAVAAALGIQLSVVPLQTSHAQDADNRLEEITVTASRRAISIQDIPINISAVTADQIQELQLSDLRGMSKWVPGLTVLEQGNRDGTPILVRGLNLDSFSEPRGAGGTVGTYIGEIPTYIDLNLKDIDRVEFLIGPQGTLYGAGTLGGAIRYIPKRVDLNEFEAEVYAGMSQYAESGELGWETGIVLNKPLLDGKLGFRASYGVEEIPGFIDYNFVVREPGLSNPQPDFDDPVDVADNLRQVEDANGSRIDSGRVAVRYKPTDSFDATLTYYYQNQVTEGRSLVHYYPEVANPSNFSSGKYESGYRYEEPLERTDQLLSLEMTYNLDFAEVVASLGSSKSERLGQRDQTDLLLDFQFGYELFPSFTAFTRDEVNRNISTAEIRMVSTGDGSLSWIVGAFYNKIERDQDIREFTPGLPEFWGVTRPDNLEFIQTRDGKTTEQAIYGEIGFQFTDKWQATVGARAYSYNDDLTVNTSIPLFLTLIGVAGPEDIPFRTASNRTDDSGSLFKFNTSYAFNDDVMAYYTLSEGYRVGGINALAPCPDPLPPGPNECGLPGEIEYLPDTTLNNEIGIRSKFLDNRLVLNAAIFYIDWDDVQVIDVTENGGLHYTANGGGAKSKGVELSLSGQLADNWTMNMIYSYTKAELTTFVPGLVGEDDAFPGDRLPASPETTAGLNVAYYNQVFDGLGFSANYDVAYTGDIYTKVGLRSQGERLPAFTTHGVSATLSGQQWAGTIYVKNLTDEYAVTGVRQDPSFLRDINGFDLRWYGRWINTPRNIGVRFTYHFD